MSKRKIFFIIYTILIILGLIYILFIADDKMFQKKDKPKNNISTKEVKKKTLEEKEEYLLSGNYEYHFDLNYGSIQYKCSGEKNGSKDNGSCDYQDKVIEYNEENIKERLEDIDYNYLDLNNIFSLIKDIEYKSVDNYSSMIKYNVNQNNIDTEILIYSGSENIKQITISNINLVYVLYFDIKK